jgi:hypothetical protein
MQYAAVTPLSILVLNLPFPPFAQPSAGNERCGHWRMGGSFGAGGEMFFNGGYRGFSNVALEADFLGR